MMITLKTFDQKTYQVAVEDSSISVKDLKIKIVTMWNNSDWTTEKMDLIYAGCILNDDLPLSHYKIEDKFVVCMKKPSAKVPTANSDTVPVVNGNNSQSNIDLQEAARAIMSIGLDDPNQAVELLLPGIEQKHALNPSEENVLTFLLQDPQFRQMALYIRDDRSFLNSFLEQIHQTNPDLLTLINQHQREFLDIVNELNSQEREHDVYSDSVMPQSTSQTIHISPEDRDVIERLMALGFSENLVIQAFFACDKNEELIVDFLLSQNENN